MQSFADSLQTAAFSVLGGVLIVVIGQLIIKFWIEPLQNLYRTRAEITELLNFYANVGPGLDAHYGEQLNNYGEANTSYEKLVGKRYEELIMASWKRQDDASSSYRRLASQLLANTDAIPLYFLVAPLNRLPSYDSVIKGYTQLIALESVFQFTQDTCLSIRRDEAM